MKPLPLILMLSLGLNAAIGAALVKRAREQPPETNGAALGTVAAAASAAPEAPAPATWPELQSLDTEALIARLRAQGLSPTLIRAIVNARINAEFEPRLRRYQRRPRAEYWTTLPFRFAPLTAADQAALRRLNHERTALLERLLGPDAAPDDRAAYQRRRYGDLNAAKIEQLEALEGDYRELQANIRSDSKGLLLQEDRDKLAFLEAEKQADLASLLTPEELAAYELRSSPTANQLRQQLRAFDPSEDEYVALFRLHKAMSDELSGTAQTPEQHQRRLDRQAEIDRQAAELLGPERHAEYLLKTHSSWPESERWVKQQQLPDATTAQLVAIQRDLNDRARALQLQRDLPPEQRRAVLANLAQEARSRLTQVLVPDQLTAYQSGPGRWLRALEPPSR